MDNGLPVAKSSNHSSGLQLFSSFNSLPPRAFQTTMAQKEVHKTLYSAPPVVSYGFSNPKRPSKRLAMALGATLSGSKSFQCHPPPLCWRLRRWNRRPGPETRPSQNARAPPGILRWCIKNIGKNGKMDVEKWMSLLWLSGFHDGLKVIWSVSFTWFEPVFDIDPFGGVGTGYRMLTRQPLTT